MQLCVCATIDLKFSLFTPLHTSLHNTSTTIPKDENTVATCPTSLFHCPIVHVIALYISSEIRQRKSRRGRGGRKGWGSKINEQVEKSVNATVNNLWVTFTTI
jgi:hypothetical protein